VLYNLFSWEFYNYLGYPSISKVLKNYT